VLAGRYRVGGLLGRGGMAEVFDGFDERLHRPVAVKLLRPEMAARDDIRVRFEAEARAAAGLGHPNVVAVFDTGEDDGAPFIVMERLPGETLADRMRGGPLDPRWVRRVAGDVLLALEAAHAAGIVHRDVKPGNILLASDGCAKVADFGIAKSLEVASQSVTATSQLVGTPAYLAPERIDGHPATPQSDLYSLGVVLYEALTGEKAFDGKTPVAVAYAVRHQPPPPLREVRADVPPDLAAAIERAMDPDPARRFGTGREMAMAMDAATPIGDAPTVAVAAAAPPAGSHDETRVMPAMAPAPAPAPGAPVVRRGQLLAGGVVVLLLMLLLLPLCRDGGDGGGGVAADLRSVAGSLDSDDGPRHEDAEERTRRVADAVDAGGGADMANDLLRQVAAWRAAGELTPEAATRLQEALLQVPGTDSANAQPPSTAPPPTQPPATQPPQPADEEDGDTGGRGKKGKGGKDDD
jgi:hypothetical protein